MVAILSFVEGGQKKTLIPCYKGIDAYDMPKEFAKLQAQDMGKVGAIQDLLRGIGKLIPKGTEQTVTVQQVIQSGPTTANLLKRAHQALEDRAWGEANGFFEQVLDIDAECAEAFFGKALAEVGCSDMESFRQKQLNVKIVTSELLSWERYQENTINERRATIMQKYRVPGYLDDGTIASLFTFERSIKSTTDSWLGAISENEELWNSNRNLLRAAQYATGTFAEQLNSLHEDVRTQLKNGLDEAQKITEPEVQQASIELQQALQQAEQEAAKMQQKALAQKMADEKERKRKLMTKIILIAAAALIVVPILIFKIIIPIIQGISEAEDGFYGVVGLIIIGVIVHFARKED